MTRLVDLKKLSPERVDWPERPTKFLRKFLYLFSSTNKSLIRGALRQDDTPSYYIGLRELLLDIGLKASQSVPSSDGVPTTFGSEEEDLGTWTEAMTDSEKEGWAALTWVLQMEENLIHRAFHLLLRSRLYRPVKTLTTAITDINEAVRLLIIHSNSEHKRGKEDEDETNENYNFRFLESLIGDIITHLHFLVATLSVHLHIRYSSALKKWWTEMVLSKLANENLPLTPSSGLGVMNPLWNTTMYQLASSNSFPLSSSSKEPWCSLPHKAPTLMRPHRLKCILPHPKTLSCSERLVILDEALAQFWKLLDNAVPRHELVPTPDGNNYFYYVPERELSVASVTESASFPRPPPSERYTLGELPRPLFPPQFALERHSSHREFEFYCYELSRNPKKPYCGKFAAEVIFEAEDALVVLKTQEPLSRGTVIIESNVIWSGVCKCRCLASNTDLKSTDVQLEMLALEFNLPELLLIPKLFSVANAMKTHHIITIPAVHWSDKLIWPKEITEEALRLREMETGFASIDGASFVHEPSFPFLVYNELWKRFPYRDRMEFQSFLDMLTIIRMNAFPLVENSIQVCTALEDQHSISCPVRRKWKVLAYPAGFALLRASTDAAKVNVKVEAIVNKFHPNELDFQLTVLQDIAADCHLFFNPNSIPHYDWCRSCKDPRHHQRCDFKF